MRKWLPGAYGTHHNTASTARNGKNPTREFRRINPGLILLKVASTHTGDDWDPGSNPAELASLPHRIPGQNVG